MVKQIWREKLEKAYDEEKDADVSRRILLVLKVRCDGMKQSHAAKELLRDKSWATIWLRRFDEEGLDSLKDRPRSGRPLKADGKKLLKVRREITKLPDGVQVKWVRELIHREAKVTYSSMQVYRILHRWGFRRIVPEKRFVNKAPKEERELFKKEPRGSSRTSPKDSRWSARTSP